MQSEMRAQQSMGFPPPERSEPLACPRCDSTATKFCYYNNYNLSQPRYLCKSCRRYWTHGGTLRNVPVGGATRKPKISNNSSSRTTPTSSASSSSSSNCVPSSSTIITTPSSTATHLHVNTCLTDQAHTQTQPSLGFAEFSYAFTPHTTAASALLSSFSDHHYNAPWDDHDLAWPTLAISTPHHPPN